MHVSFPYISSCVTFTYKYMYIHISLSIYMYNISSNTNGIINSILTHTQKHAYGDNKTQGSVIWVSPGNLRK